MISSVESSWAEFPLEPFSCEDGAEDGSSRPNRLTEVSGVDPGDANPPPSEVAVEDGEEVIGFAFWIRKARKLLIFSQNWQIYLVNKQCSFSEEAFCGFDVLQDRRDSVFFCFIDFCELLQTRIQWFVYILVWNIALGIVLLSLFNATKGLIHATSYRKDFSQISLPLKTIFSRFHEVTSCCVIFILVLR